eukprot:4796908-Karenia_brevis.AAC.1
MDGHFFTPAIGVALLRAQSILRHGMLHGHEEQYYTEHYASISHIPVITSADRSNLENILTGSIATNVKAKAAR